MDILDFKRPLVGYNITSKTSYSSQESLVAGPHMGKLAVYQAGSKTSGTMILQDLIEDVEFRTTQQGRTWWLDSKFLLCNKLPCFEREFLSWSACTSLHVLCVRNGEAASIHGHPFLQNQ